MIESIIHNNLLPFDELQLKRNDHLIHQGEIERYFYYVIEGALIAYTVIEEEEYTIRFAYKDSIVASLPAYFTAQPSEVGIQAIRKSKVIRFKKSDLDAFVEKDLDSLKQYLELMRQLVASFFEREIDLMTTSPKERLNRLLKRSPQVFQEIPNKYIASYLRMTPETLSRLLKS